MAVSIVDAKNVVEPVKKSIEIINRRVADWKQVVPEGKALQRECEIFQGIIVGVLDKPELPFNLILEDVQKMIGDTSTLIHMFEAQDNRRGRSVGSAIVWKLKRVYLSRKYRHYYKSMTQQLEVSKKKIQDTLAFWAAVNKPTMHWYSEEMVNKKSFAFWLEICGAGPYAAKWVLFIEAYRHHYPEFQWNDHVEERIRHASCSYGDLLTIRGFIQLTKKCGFPLIMDKLPKVTCEQHASSSSLSRINITQLLNDLIDYSNSDEFLTKIHPVLTWYVGCQQRNGITWQARANTWAEAMVEYREQSLDTMDEHGKEILAVDNARRTYVAFFQRCMATMNISHLCRVMFSQVGFPGIALIRDFLDRVQPLDHAHYHIVMGGNPDDWQDKQPQVYTFFKDVLMTPTEEGKKGKSKAEAYHDAAAEMTLVHQAHRKHAPYGLSVGTDALHTHDEMIMSSSSTPMTTSGLLASGMTVGTSSAYRSSNIPFMASTSSSRH